MQDIMAGFSLTYVFILSIFFFLNQKRAKTQENRISIQRIPWLSLNFLFFTALIFIFTYNFIHKFTSGLNIYIAWGAALVLLVIAVLYYIEQFPTVTPMMPWHWRILGTFAFLLGVVFLHFLMTPEISYYLWLVYGLAFLIYIWNRLSHKKKRMNLRQKDLANVLLIAVIFSAFAFIMLGFIFPWAQKNGYQPDITFLHLMILHTSLLFFITTAMAVHLFPFFDFRTFALRLSQCLIISFSVSVVFALLANSRFFFGAHQFWLVMGFVFFAFFLGIIYRTFFLDSLTHFFFPQLINPNTVKLRLFEYRKLASGDIDIAQFLKEIVDLVHSYFPVKKGVLLTRNHFYDLVKYETGDAELDLSNNDRRVFLKIFRRLAINKKTLQELHNNILLDKFYLRNFSEYEKLKKKYPRLMAGFSALTEKLYENQCKIILPLIFENEVYGVYFIGEKQKERPYYTYDINFLQSIRSILTMLVRNRIYIDEMNYQRLEARKEVHSLTNFITLEKCQTHQFMDKSLVFKSTQMQTVINKAKEASQNNFPVLLTGETGTGKDMIAQFIHDSSERKNEPFVHINCAAIPEYLWEDKIFGHIKGAFTDAKESRLGMVAAAGQGTLFFDEIGEMPLEMQPKLLQLIQEGQYYPLGSEKAEKSKCRLIFATNRNLKEMIEKKQFRDDLYYRIHVLPIHLPPLYHRQEDVPILVEHFIQKYRRDCNEPGDIQLDGRAMEMLRAYAWPGNVRELENIIIRVLATKKGHRITAEDIPSELRSKIGSSSHGKIKNQNKGSFASLPRKTDLNQNDISFPVDFDQLIRDYSGSLIKSAMDQTGGNISHAAELLKMKRARLSYQVKELGLKKDDELFKNIK